MQSLSASLHTLFVWFIASFWGIEAYQDKPDITTIHVLSSLPSFFCLIGVYLLIISIKLSLLEQVKLVSICLLVGGNQITRKRAYMYLHIETYVRVTTHQ